MITLQHTLCDLIKNEGNLDQFSKEISFCLLPDAIRYYIGPRPFSHFEENPTGNDISWYKYPENLKKLTKETAQSQEKHLAEINKKSCLGETINIETFMKTNNTLPENEYNGILMHLIQDYIFDDWIRKVIDCSDKYEPNENFKFHGRNYDGKGIRAVIKDLEEYGFYILSLYCYQNYGIITNQEWFDKNVYMQMKKDYPEDLANATYKYMQIPPHINEKITNKDWSELKYPKYNAEYSSLYKQIIHYTKDTNKFFEEAYKVPKLAIAR